MLRNAVRLLWAEPRAPEPPRRVWRDWALVAALVPTAILEGVLRHDVVWRPVAVALAAGLAVVLLWRRTHPLAVVVVVFGAIIVLHIASLLSIQEPVGLNTMIYVLLLPYSLARWGSGREVAIGLAVILVTVVLGVVVDSTRVLDAVLGSLLLLLFPATLGAAARYRTVSRSRELDKVRLREREQLARELHDTVAHHVSAIAIRAQAGRVVAGSDPAAAVDALSVIEAEASRTLAEMRVMVGNLRENETPTLAPQPGVADLDRLSRGAGEPRVDVEVSGDLEDLGPSVGAAIYRIAQESITNAVRHARHATRITVRVAGEDDCVRLTVNDDGDPSSTARNSLGFGLVGMTERAMLLGGSFEAGPSPDRGWTVEAVLPRTGAAR
jgi:signal transduction histidine kinase